MFKNSLALLALTALAACGGGSGSGDGGAATHSAGTGSAGAVLPAVGDYETYKRVITAAEGPMPSATGNEFFKTEAVASLVAGGGVVGAKVEPYAWRRDVTYDADGGLTQTGVYRCQFSHTPALFLDLPRSGKAGMSWTINSAQTLLDPAQSHYCGDGDTYVGSLTSHSFEPVTVGIGSFNALKVTASYTRQYKASLEKYKAERKCWRDTTLHINVKCKVIEESVYNGILQYRTTTEYELVAYARANANRRLDNVVRFAGAWEGSFTPIGGEAQTCSVMIDRNGAVSGTCGGTVAGIVAIDGTISFKPEAGKSGLTFKGKLDNPLKGQGSYISSAGNGGTLQLTHT
ncbi:MAG: hypothetical protein K0R43_4304 [Pseudoduganella sp.]|jgi:hypothetical protein|nr:hypothetical protein [Pseudoduganella sp.]